MDQAAFRVCPAGAVPVSGAKARVIALYLPQFHPTAVNDRYWGRGFTEWNNVLTARPLFRGHCQPNLPGALGAYDLRDPAIRQAQADFAREAGIEGFCYWHYWFGNGLETLTLPLDETVRLGKPDFPFCVGWANHDWSTASWQKGKAAQPLQRIFTQAYPGTEDEVRHFHRLLPAFRDQRYIRVEGKLLFLVYQPEALPQPQAWMARWNALARQYGLEGFHFVGLMPSLPDLTLRSLLRPDACVDARFDAVRSMGFQAVMSTNQKYAELKAGGRLHKILFGALRRVRPGMLPEIYDYSRIIHHFYTAADRRTDVYPQLLAGWDRSPRAGRRAIIYTGRTPEAFAEAARRCLACVRDKPSEKRIIFLNSWNEWGEGAYMEPDARFGDAFLQVLKKELLS